MNEPQKQNGYRLVCDQDPVKLGIETPDGAWHMPAFIEHTKNCEECRMFLTKTKRQIIDRLHKDDSFLLKVIPMHRSKEWKPVYSDEDLTVWTCSACNTWKTRKPHEGLPKCPSCGGKMVLTDNKA